MMKELNRSPQDFFDLYAVIGAKPNDCQAIVVHKAWTELFVRTAEFFSKLPGYKLGDLGFMARTFRSIRQKLGYLRRVACKTDRTILETSGSIRSLIASHESFFYTAEVIFLLTLYRLHAKNFRTKM